MWIRAARLSWRTWAQSLPSAAARPPAKAPRIAAPNATMAVSTRQVSSVAMIFATNTVLRVTDSGARSRRQWQRLRSLVT